MGLNEKIRLGNQIHVLPSHYIHDLRLSIVLSKPKLTKLANLLVIIVKAVPPLAVAPVAAPGVGAALAADARGLRALVYVHTHLVVRGRVAEPFATRAPVRTPRVQAFGVVGARLEGLFLVDW